MQPPQDWQPPRDSNSPQDWQPQDPVPGGPYDQGPARPGPARPDVPGRGQFRWAPFPSYSRTTGSGTRLSVGGCCLPLPIGCLATVLTVGGAVVVRALRHGAGG